jgi:hypothetical protein
MSRRALTFAVLGLLAAPAASADTAAVQRTWLERVAISAADKSCNLFSVGERLALQSGYTRPKANSWRQQDRRRDGQLATSLTHARHRHPSVVEVAATVRSIAGRQFPPASVRT